MNHINPGRYISRKGLYIEVLSVNGATGKQEVVYKFEQSKAILTTYSEDFWAEYREV